MNNTFTPLVEESAEQVPFFIPQSIIDAIRLRYHPDETRLSKAIAIVEAGEVSTLPNGNFAVKSHSKNAPVVYQYNPRYESCTCKDGSAIVSGDGTLLREANLCKHAISLLLLREMNTPLPVTVDVIGEREKVAQV